MPDPDFVRVRVRTLSWYLGVALVATVAAVLYLRPWTATDLTIFPRGVDELWQQAIFQVFGQAGPIGTTDHLAYPLGMSGWALPQTGLVAGTFAWLAVGLLGLSAGAAVLWFQAFSAGLNAAALLFAMRAFPAGRKGWLAPVIAVTMGAAPWTVSHQLNLALFVLIPLVIGQMVRWEREGALRPSWWKWAMLAFVSAVLPLWWTVVFAVVLPFAMIAPAARRNWSAAASIAAGWSAVVVGAVVQAALFVAHIGPGSDTSRSPWQSNWASGHMVDLIVGNPLITWLLPRTLALREGASVEANWGLTITLLAALALTALLVLPPARWRGAPTLVLASITVVTTLFWLTGGLGNLQAGVGVLLGVTSPARGWYRLLLVLAVIGCLWLMLALSQRESFGLPARVLVSTGTVLLAAAWLAELRIDYQTREMPITVSAYSEMVAEIRARVSPGCPIAQVPNEAVPNQRVTPPAFVGDPLTYRSYLPFALAPEFKWSGGSWEPGQTGVDNPVTGLPLDVAQEDLRGLVDGGYCAVLLDKQVSQEAIKRDVVVEGRAIDASVGQPAWQNDIYALYLLQ